MKFKTDMDAIQYDLLKLNEIEVRKRLQIVSRAKDHKKSREMKNHWRRNKKKIIKGISKWSRSTAGKRFHRALGRFNALRESASINPLYTNKNIVNMDMKQVNDALLGLSSIETHLYLELQYYESDPEAMIQFLDIIDDFVMDSSFLKVELLVSYKTGEMEMENYELLTDIIQFFQDPKSYLFIKREMIGKSNDIKDADFTKQIEVIKNLDLSMSGNEIYNSIDELFIK